MKRGGGVHTVPSLVGAGWWNRLDGRVISRHRLKESAEEAGRAVARELAVEHTIHLSDGTIGEKNSYGNGPRAYFKPSFFLAASSAIDSRMRLSRVSGRLAV
jgi:hypothetical protein